MDASSRTETEVLAWTEADGPGRAPKQPSRAVLVSVAATLTVTLAGILASDALCPDHRLWVQTLAGLAVVGAATSVVLSVRRQAAAPLFALGSSVLGMAIGVIDAVHDPGRGTLIVVGFALAAVGSAALALRVRMAASWGRELSTAHVALAAVEAVPTTEPATDPAVAIAEETRAPAGVDGRSPQR